MNHSDALKLNAAEKYLLGELTADEREAYEDHYFTCPECAEDVKAGAVLLDNARAVLRSDFQPIRAAVEPRLKPREEPRGWFGWLRPAYALAAIVILIVAVSYQSYVTIPRLRRDIAANTPQTLASYSLVTLGSRSNARLVVTSEPSRPFGLYVDIPAKDNFASYTCRVVSESGSQAFAVQISAAQARDTVQLLIPGFTLKTGNYVLVISGNRTEQGPQAAGEEIARYTFAFQAQ